MTRELRVDYPGSLHHVFNRSIAGLLMFSDADDYADFIRLLGKLERYGVHVYGYCLMSNHFHLLVYSAEGRLAEAMQMLCSQFVQRYNKRHGRRGPLLESRYENRIVQTDVYALRVLRYIHLNPVAAGMVDFPEQHVYSSYAGLVGLAPLDSFVDPSLAFEQFGGNREAIIDFTNEGVDAKTADLLASKAKIIGDAPFVAEVEKRLREEGADPVLYRIPVRPDQKPEVSQVVETVRDVAREREEQSDLHDLDQRRRERDLSILAARRFTASTLASLAREFGVSESSIGRSTRRAEASIISNAEAQVLKAEIWRRCVTLRGSPQAVAA